jgi:hypothetical protein
MLVEVFIAHRHIMFVPFDRSQNRYTPTRLWETYNITLQQGPN